MSDFIHTSLNESILTLSICRPSARNAVNQDMYLALAEGLEKAQREPTIHVVLLKGGKDIFCGGNDMQDFAAMSQGQPDQYGGRFMKALINCDTPIVAAVNGAAIGIGATLLQYVDFLYVSPTARLQTPFVAMGLCPEFGSSQRLEQQLGVRKARAMLLAGDPLSAQEAITLGFANEICDDPDAAAMKRATGLASLAPKAMQNSKAMLMREYRQQLLKTVDYENQQLMFLITQPESQEAVSAFMEKRVPDFSEC
jgi:enoyl-CoA hydratase/carnithine racemase